MDLAVGAYAPKAKVTDVTARRLRVTRDDLINDVRIKRFKGIWWMPRHTQAMKDVARCDKLWGVVSKL